VSEISIILKQDVEVATGQINNDITITSGSGRLEYKKIQIIEFITPLLLYLFASSLAKIESSTLKFKIFLMPF